MSIGPTKRLFLRWSVPLLVVISTGLSARMVHWLNFDLGGWVILIVLLGLVFSLGNVAPISKGTILLHGCLFVSSCVLFGWVSIHATKTVRCTVDTNHGTVDIASDTRYVDVPGIPEKIQIHAVNDVWELRNPDSVQVRSSLVGDTGEEARIPLTDFLRERNGGRKSEAPSRTALIAMVLLFVISLLTTATAVAQFFTGAPFTWRSMRTRRGLALFVVAGILLAAIKVEPTNWLSNTFLSRWDDWLRYGTAARAILAGNVALIPIPGGMEMWGLGYAYVVAVVQLILGPALIPVHVFMHGLNYAVVWACMVLVSPDKKWHALAAGAMALGFVEVDLNLNYAWVLLSDTLPLVLFAVILVAAIRGLYPRWLALGTGVLFLLRSDYIMIGPLLALFYLYRGSFNPKAMAKWLVPWSLCVALYLLRKAVVTGDLFPFPLPNTSNGIAWDALINAQNFKAKVWALFGRYDLLNTAAQHRFHWWPVHLLFLLAIVRSLVKRTGDRWVLFMASVWLWFLCTRLATPSIGNYGHRHSLALVFTEIMVVVLVFGRNGDSSDASATPRVASM
ncbi:MAG: hypothetical protein IPI72_09645 [Flavobacteriales bacterium]|nr:hypothetical protein [Flavobacteriales bacterium]